MTIQRDWETSYNNWKSGSWPECPPIDRAHLLPEHIKKELAEDFKCSIVNYRKIFSTDVGRISMYYQADHDGGGTTFGQEYISVLKEKYSHLNIDWCYEWCSGPGFIGYSILESNLCKKLFLSDLWEPAISDAEYTRDQLDLSIRENVTIHLLKDVALIPKQYQFDLVVSNPPHFPQWETVDYHGNRISTDLDWKAHNNFFKNIKKNLSADGIILLQENSDGSTVDDFHDMIVRNGLTIKDSFTWQSAPMYYIEITHA